MGGEGGKERENTKKGRQQGWEGERERREGRGRERET